MRQLSAIFDTRALGYTSSLVAARYPDDRLFEAAAIVGGHPGVSHNYRRTHAFNLWYTLAVEPDSRLGLEETMERLHEETAAESMRLLPTLKLYKINVQLDMTGTQATDAKEDAPRPPADARRRRAADRRRQGDDRDPPARPAGGIAPLRHLGGRGGRRDGRAAGRRRGVRGPQLHAPLRRGAQPPQGRVRRQRHGRVEGARGGAGGARARAWPPSRPSRTATSARPTRTGPTASSRWSTSAPRRRARRPSPPSPRRPASPTPAGARCSTRPSSSRRSGSCTSRRTTASGRTWRWPGAPLPRWGNLSTTTTRSAELFERARRVLVGGVNSPVRAMRSIGRDPLFIARGRGPGRVGRRRQPLRRLPLDLGPGDPGPHAGRRAARLRDAAAAGHLVRRAHRARGALRRGRGARRCRRSSSCA